MLIPGRAAVSFGALWKPGKSVPREKCIKGGRGGVRDSRWLAEGPPRPLPVPSAQPIGVL